MRVRWCKRKISYLTSSTLQRNLCAQWALSSHRSLVLASFYVCDWDTDLNPYRIVNHTWQQAECSFKLITYKVTVLPYTLYKRSAFSVMWSWILLTATQNAAVNICIKSGALLIAQQVAKYQNLISSNTIIEIENVTHRCAKISKLAKLLFR
jgi:hypothetical protein